MNNCRITFYIDANMSKIIYLLFIAHDFRIKYGQHFDCVKQWIAKFYCQSKGNVTLMFMLIKIASFVCK